MNSNLFLTLITLKKITESEFKYYDNHDLYKYIPVDSDGLQGKCFVNKDAKYSPNKYGSYLVYEIKRLKNEILKYEQELVKIDTDDHWICR